MTDLDVYMGCVAFIKPVQGDRCGVCIVDVGVGLNSYIPFESIRHHAMQIIHSCKRKPGKFLDKKSHVI